MIASHARKELLVPTGVAFCLLVTILGISPAIVWADEAEDQAKAIEQINKLGGKAERDEKEPGKPVTSVSLALSQVLDENMALLKALPKVQKLMLNGTKITDAGLEPLKQLGGIQKLYLVDTKITDAGLEHLKGLKTLRILSLVGTQITDAGLESLKELENLQELYVAGTKVTDDGVKKLNEALPKLKIAK